ncbi:MAG: class I SAM-dependent methyltransferase [Pseudomonadales bacterium]|nr:class I SAM-dependent methyltransferase [Pseudomonadales bacterium]
MSRLVNWFDRTFYPTFERNWDDMLFRERVLARVRPDSVVLDVGAGAGIVAAMNFRGRVARICGIDLDPRVVVNSNLDEGRVADASDIPYPDASFDLVFADNVMEHLEDPVGVFREIRRVLKPAGLLLFKTPNSTHYMPLIARCTPHRFHQMVNRMRGRHESDTFPTRYRANNVAQIERLAASTGWDIVRIERIEGRPEYLRWSGVAYALGLLYERLVNSTEGLAALRVLLVAELRKRG